MDIVSYILSKRYCDNSLIGLGALKGANCTVKDIVHQDGINTVTFEWTGTDGTTKTRDMVVYDGTPIYVWESGNTYHYGDLAIYESQFYRCIVENNDATFDSTKWNEIGSPDGNYDIVQSVNLLPARFTAADRKLYYVIDENCFYLWNGTAWVKTISNNIADLDDVNLDDLTEGDVLVWDSVNEKWVNKAKFDEYKTTFVGTQAEWDALTPAQQNVYDIINITNDGDVLNLGVYLEKKTAMPVASEDEENKIYLYTGSTIQNYKKGVVYQCVSDGQTPATYSWVALIDFGTAAIKNSTDRVSPNNTNLVESQSVYSAINTALSSIYTPRGDITCAELTSALLISDNVGNIYETSDSGTTTALFLQGAEVPIPTGSNVGIINAGQGRILFNLMANAFDLTDYQKKDLASTIEGATTVEGTLSALSTDKQSKDLATTVESATTVEGALGALSTNKQAKTLTTSVESQTTVEGALGALSTNKATQAEVTDMNNVLGAKNLIPFPYSRPSGYSSYGMTCTYDENGVITVNKTADSTTAYFALYNDILSPNVPIFLEPNKNYILSLELENATDVSCYVNDGNTDIAFLRHVTTGKHEYLFTTPAVLSSLAIGLYWINSATETNAKVKPMIRLASITDDTYEPYAKTNQELTAENQTLTNNVDVLFETGVKNICPPYLGSYSANGITYIGNSDGTVTVNGTCSANVGTNIRVYLKAGQYKVSGCPSGGSYSTYRIGVTTDSWTLIGTHDHGNGTTITIPSDGYYRINLDVRAGYVANNLVFKPMITDVDTPESDYDHYVPYAKTNKQLTEDSVTWDDYSELGSVNPINFTAITPTSPINGVTFTVNSDKSITCSDATATDKIRFIVGTATLKAGKSYRISDLKNGTANAAEDGAFGVAVRLPGSTWLMDTANTPEAQPTIYSPTTDTKVEIIVYINSGYNANRTFYPMLTCATYTGPYVPPAKTNQQLTEDTTALLDNLEVNGAVNMLNPELESQVLYGITVTKNGDGSYTLDGSSGNLTGTIFFTVALKLKANHSYKGVAFISGGTITGSGSPTYTIDNRLGTQYYKAIKVNQTIVTPIFRIDADVTNYRCGIWVPTNATFSNVIVKPMVILASIMDYAFVPYAKSNKELTEELTVASGEITRLVSFSAVTSYGIRKYGKVVELYFAGTLSEAVNIWTDFLTVPEGFRPSHYVQIVSFNTYSSCKNLQLAPSGGIQSASNLSSGDFIRFSATYIID